MKCPNCNVNLVMSDRQGVEIDYCPECRGVWLDRGELDKIIERTNLQASPSDKFSKDSYNSSRSDDYRRENDSPRKKKKESFLGDLFDF